MAIGIESPTYSHRVSRRDRKYHTRNAWLKSPERREIIEGRKRFRENKTRNGISGCS